MILSHLNQQEVGISKDAWVEDFLALNVIAKVLSDEAISDRQKKGIASWLAMTC